MRLTVTLVATALCALAGCDMPDEGQIARAPVSDPYVTTADGGVVYQGNVNRPGSRLPGDAGALPGPDAAFAAVGTTVYFAEGLATLSPDARATLARQAAWLAQNGTVTAMIEGYADEPGTREFNLALGARRATSVREYLVANGVEAGRIQTVSLGKERPAAICGSEAGCLARNRRAITIVNLGQAGI
ncbi:MAG: OmpA family protein [Paracoccus sp. (in: a-proteobacteria)]|nr:OmpA family protein [Paracoccus sp. (in: a-proteobacteria)]